MLLVVRAQAAIIGTTLLRTRLEHMRPVARLDVVLHQLEVGNIRGDQRLRYAMGLAALEVIDISVVEDDLGGHKGEALRAERRRLPVEDIGRDLTQWCVHDFSASS